MTVAYGRFETSVAFSNAFNASSLKTRFPRTRHIRSLYFYSELTIVVGTATEVSSGFEAIDKLEVEWDGLQQRWFGRQLPFYHQVFWGRPAIVGQSCYKDAAIATINASAAFRLPLGAVARSNKNVDITVTCQDGASYVEATADADAVAPTLTVYVGADYVDEMPSHATVTWTDVRDNLAVSTDFTLPLYEKPGSSVEKIFITLPTDFDDWVASTVASCQDNLWANYGVGELALTDFELDIGGQETWDMTSMLRNLHYPTTIVRPQTINNALTSGGSTGTVLSRGADFLIEVSTVTTSAARIRLTTTTIDLLMTVTFAIPNTGADEYNPPAGSTPTPPGSQAGAAPGNTGRGGGYRPGGFGTQTAARSGMRAR